MKKLIKQLIVKIKGKTKKALKSLLAIGLLMLASASALATPITAGVVTWDPDSVLDFSAGSSFKQWFTTNNNGESDANIITGDDITGAVTTADIVTDFTTNNPPENDYFLTGFGIITALNGLTSASAYLCDGCELTYAFGGLKLEGDMLSFDETDAWFTLFSDSSEEFDLLAIHEDNYAAAQDGVVWLEGGFDSFAIISGTINAGFTEGLLSVTDGLAFGNFDTNGEPEGLGGSDISLSGSAQFSSSSPYNTSGTVDFEGDTIPEPSTLAIFALALLALAGVTRAKQR
ncbi:hypothetical protein CXF85_11675 [Colwellia sp. 75C3]|uniref:PEP-CTERM sorting domain-containing protein n=1 Tax=Colwellia sp. 75C3 TaxID=888425 RepID=UPI000C31D778|nr:PEP-CTERM sorting domain-containing protein [Colwellia sp. 75C3]PKG83185.1 hypothetical protein CXF85_11675 [Colwellia sp. 75C3]